MKKSTFLLLTTILVAGGAVSQTLPEGMTSLLPEGVKANIATEQKGSKKKDLVVAGEKSKGYKAFFAASDAVNGEELWVTDGTKQGTHMVKDIWPGSSGSNVNYLTRFNDKVVFGADDGENGMELWISDGTAEGTYMVKNVHEFASSDPRGFTQVNETQFIFGAKNFDSENYDTAQGPQWWLYVSDGTEEGTELIYECDTRFPGQSYGTTWTTPYCRVGRKVFFKADNMDGTIGEELWVTDGTREGTKLVMDINTEVLTTGTAGSALDNLVNFYNEKLFFKAWSIEHGAEPWASDGTPEGTYEIKDTDPSLDANSKPRSGGVSCPGVYPYNGKVYYRGYDPAKGFELACTNLEKEDYTTFDINVNEPTNEKNGFADPGTEFDGVYMFCADTGNDAAKPNNFGGELHYTDGKTVTMQSDRAPGSLSHWVKDLTVVSGSLYWWNAGGAVAEDKEKLFRIDNKEQFPVRVTNFNPAGDKVHTLRNLNGDLLFATNDENKALYIYHYRKEGFDPIKDADDLDKCLEFRTRAEMEGTGIKTTPIAEETVIYPNPASEKFSFNIHGTIISVKIYDVSGRLLKEETQLTENTVDISSLPKGVYQVLFTGTEGSFVSKLLVN